MVLKLNLIYKIIISLIIIIGLYFISQANYLLFHSLAEIFSIIIAGAFFIITWNSKQYIKNNYLIFIGIAYFFIAGLDLLHTLSYKGINIFKDYDYYANQLWIAARYLESLTLLIAFLLLSKQYTINVNWYIAAYLLITALILISIFYYKNFPKCFVEDKGLTNFKIISEYIISFILLVNTFLLYKYRRHFEPKVYQYLIASFITTILAELAFTFYIDNYGFSNQVGHYFKIISFYLIYKAIIETGLKQPYALMFRELKENERELKELNATKDKFFAIIAHDLKNPFSTLIGFSDLLLKRHKKYTVEKREKIYESIFNVSKQSYALLNNLLTWSRSQTGSISVSIEKLLLFNIIEENISLLSEIAKSKEIEIENRIDNKLLVMADKEMLDTIIRNLITNAVKFSYRRGKIIVSAALKANKVQVSIKDFGVGIKAENQKKIFNVAENYQQKGTEKEKGTGLGLILCKEFIEKQNGKIWVESQINKGSNFFFEIPVAKN